MKITPQIESILAEMTQLCCDALGGDTELDVDRLKDLAESLSANGWERHSHGEGPLSKHLEHRIKQECPEQAMHRGAAIDSLVDRVQSLLDSESRRFAKVPDQSNEGQSLPPRSTY